MRPRLAMLKLVWTAVLFNVETSFKQRALYFCRKRKNNRLPIGTKFEILYLELANCTGHYDQRSTTIYFVLALRLKFELFKTMTQPYT